MLIATIFDLISKPFDKVDGLALLEYASGLLFPALVHYYHTQQEWQAIAVEVLQCSCYHLSLALLDLTNEILRINGEALDALDSVDVNDYPVQLLHECLQVRFHNMEHYHF